MQFSSHRVGRGLQQWPVEPAAGGEIVAPQEEILQVNRHFVLYSMFRACRESFAQILAAGGNAVGKPLAVPADEVCDRRIMATISLSRPALGTR